MKHAAGPVETKVAAATAVPVIVGAVFTAAQFYQWFTPPPSGVTAGLVAVLTGLAGWFAPHTSRQSAEPVAVALSSPGTTPAQVIAAIRDAVHKVEPADPLPRLLADPPPLPRLLPDPPATGTGPVTP